jgi:hypothetical protein
MDLRITRALSTKVSTWTQVTQQTESQDTPRLFIRVSEESIRLCTMILGTTTSINLSKIQTLLPSTKSKQTPSKHKILIEVNTQESNLYLQLQTLPKEDRPPNTSKRILCSMAPWVVATKEQVICMAGWWEAKAVLDESREVMRLFVIRRWLRNIQPNEVDHYWDLIQVKKVIILKISVIYINLY